MDRRCAIETCKREAETRCYHCSQDVCSKHFLEHKTWIQEQLPLLTDEVNLVYERLRRSDKNQMTYGPQYLINVSRDLDKWREDCHQHIDIVYQRVRNQIGVIIESRKQDETQKAVQILESLEKMRQQLKELLEEGDVTYRQLETMKQQLREIKKKEQESTKYPDIGIITQKIDVSKCVDVIIDGKPPIHEQVKSRSKYKTSPNEKPWVERMLTLTSSMEELIQKCPECYIYFPSNMTCHGRTQHINDHYADD